MDFSITTVQSDLYWEDKKANFKLFDEAIQKTSEKSRLIILPEMFTTGFSMNTKDLAEEMNGHSIHWMIKQSEITKKHIVGSLIIKDNGCFFNRLVVASPNGEISFYDKKHLFSYANEDKNYTPGNKELIVSIEGIKIAFFICYDLRFPVWCRNYQLKYDVAVYIANWPEKRKEHWSSLLKARAIENQSFVIGVNRIGRDGNNIEYSGDSAVYDYLGKKISTTKTREQKTENLFLNMDNLHEYRLKFPTHLDADEFKIQ